VNFDEIVFADLTAAHAAVTDVQVIAGTGTNGQVLGVRNTPGITTITVASQDIIGFYRAVANGIQLIHSLRFLPPSVCVMHPRRWGWLTSLLDTTNRPLVIPSAQGVMNAAGVLTDVASQQVVGTVQGLPIVTDPSVPTNLGYAANQDPVFVMRAEDLALWETGIRARVLMEPKASTLSAVLQVYSYLAFTAGRMPQSIVEIDGFSPPSF
jgi:HK97 family phage major capsid protein